MNEDSITKILNAFNAKAWEKYGLMPDEWLCEQLADLQAVTRSETLREAITTVEAKSFMADVVDTKMVYLDQAIEALHSLEQNP